MKSTRNKSSKREKEALKRGITIKFFLLQVIFWFKSVIFYYLSLCCFPRVLSQLLPNQRVLLLLKKTGGKKILWENQHPHVNCNCQTTIQTLMRLCPFHKTRFGGSIKYRQDLTTCLSFRRDIIEAVLAIT